MSLIQLSLFFFLFVYSSHSINKIRITGSVADAQTDTPLPYANIQVLNTNWGTTTNSEGKFEIVLDENKYTLKFSYIGYISQSVDVDKSSISMNVKLKPVPIELKAVEVTSYKGNYTWEEEFILKAIEKKKEFLSRLSHYQAYAYSKTSISKADTSEELFAFIESISEIGFIPPDYFREKILDLKMPRILENYPYEDMGIRLNVDLHLDEVKLQKFSIISPLNDNALDYYSYHIKSKILQDTDTLVTLSITPKTNLRPLFMGELTFIKNNYCLIEADLAGNPACADGFIDKVSFLQRYNLKEEYNIPAFSKVRLRMNLSGLRVWISQENTLINYLFNQQASKPIVALDRQILFEPNIQYSIDKNREKIFHVPLTEKEVKARNKIDSLYTNAPFYLKLILYCITDIPFLVFDKPASLAGIKFSRFSNLYRFNKVEGHYVGFDYRFADRENFNLFGSLGYSINGKLLEYNFRTRYGNFILESQQQIVNLGRFPFNKVYNSLTTLFTHEDPLHYFLVHNAELSLRHNIGTKWNIKLSVCAESQKPVSNSTEFSFFGTDKKYLPNYQIEKCWNNHLGAEISYIENNTIDGDSPIIYKGGSFLNFNLKYQYSSMKLNSAENRSSLDFNFHELITFANPFSFYSFANLHFQDKTQYFQNMNFTNRYEPMPVEESSLTFYTLNNYDLYAENYFRLKSEMCYADFFKGTTAGVVFSLLHPFKYNSQIENTGFEKMNKDFYEYGIFLKGITYFNFYVLLNNREQKKPLYLLTFYF